VAVAARNPDALDDLARRWRRHRRHVVDRREPGPRRARRYVSAEHGLEGLTRVAAREYGHLGVRVNALAPGPILTDNLARAGAAAQERTAAALPAGRIGRPDEVAAAAVWLTSDAAAFVTGANLVIDGGMTAGTPPFAGR
jgi:NAD(P)-dependent dehydrogenase (short-subunit alcohol dehydrogenase family)